MADGSLPAPAPGEHLYLQARRFFATSFKEAATAVDGGDGTDDLVDALLDLFKLVVIDLEDNDDAQVIFEVLNGRQTPLSASDLVKNLLFLRGELGDEAELEKLYDTYWAEFDEEWWKATVGTGHAARGRRDVLLSVWLTAASGSEASVAHLYGQVRNYLALGDIKTEQILIELHAYGKAYKAICGASPAGSVVLKVVYARLDKLKILTAVPLLAWLRTLPESQIATEDHERAALAVESWVVRRMILGANTRGYGTAFLQLLKQAEEAAIMGENVADVIEAGLVSSPNSLGWPTDVDVAGAFATDKFYDRFTQERIRLVLGAIDEQLRKENPKTEPAVFTYDALQIEHVMPRAWRDHWPLPHGADKRTSWLSEHAIKLCTV